MLKEGIKFEIDSKRGWNFKFGVTSGLRRIRLEIESLKAGIRYSSIEKLKAALEDPRTGRIVLGAMLNLGRRQGG